MHLNSCFCLLLADIVTLSDRFSKYNGSYAFKHTCFTSIKKQVLTSYTNLSRFCFLGTTPDLEPNVRANENIKVDIPSRESNSGPQDYEVDTRPHYHGQHTDHGHLTTTDTTPTTDTMQPQTPHFLSWQQMMFSLKVWLLSEILHKHLHIIY